jgi:hypothetical protein
MAMTSTGDKASNTLNQAMNPSDNQTVPFPDLARVNEMNGNMLSDAAKFNTKVGATMQQLGKEWFGFVGKRLHEDLELFHAIHACRSLPDLQHVYTLFWQDAFAQYGEQAKRMMWIAQGAAEDVAAAVEEERRDPPARVTMTDKAA